MTKISTCQQFHQVKMYNVRRSVLQCAQICRDLPNSVQINQDLIGSVWLCQNVKQIVKLSQYHFCWHIQLNPTFELNSSVTLSRPVQIIGRRLLLIYRVVICARCRWHACCSVLGILQLTKICHMWTYAEYITCGHTLPLAPLLAPRSCLLSYPLWCTNI